LPSLYNDDVSIVLPDLRFNGELAGSDAVAVSGSRPVEITCAPVDAASAASLSVGEERLGPPSMRLGERRWRWEWQPRGRVGTFAVRLSVTLVTGGPVSRETVLFVPPAKIDGASFEQLLAAIQKVASSLAYSLAGGDWGAALGSDPGDPHTLIEEHWHRLSHEASLAEAATRAIGRRPQVVLRQYVEERNLAALGDVGPEALASWAARPLDASDTPVDSPLTQRLPRAPDGKLRLPRTLPERVAEVTTQGYEHALLVRILDELLWRCGYVREALRSAKEKGPESEQQPGAVSDGAVTRWEAEVAAVTRSLQRARGSDFLAGVEPARGWHGPTSLMRRDPRYRAIGRLWHMLFERPFVALAAPMFDMPVADAPTLYEQWSLLEVVRACAASGALIEQQLLQPSARPYLGITGVVWKARLNEDKPLARWRRGDGAQVEVYYRRRYRPDAGHGPQLGSLDPFLRIPDIVVEVLRPGGRPEALVFDAKYRVAVGGGIPEDALADAYTYHAAIGYAGVPASMGTYLLFPGTDGFEAEGVGAIPLLPGRAHALDELVRRHLARLQ
jgi:large subunit ribosomal protein MRP49